MEESTAYNSLLNEVVDVQDDIDWHLDATIKGTKP
jgi:hypothetical protein